MKQQFFFLMLWGLFFLTPLWSRDFLQTEFTLHLEGEMKGLDSFPVPVLLHPDEGMEILRERAIYYFSGMSYGYHFVYIPSYTDRSIEESFILEPQVRLAEDRIRLLDFSLEGRVLKASFLMNYGEHEKAWKQKWDSIMIPVSEGKTESLQSEENGRDELMFPRAVKDAVKQYLRTTEMNRPREAEGLVLLDDYPVTGFSSGRYYIKVRVKIKIQSLKKYEVY